jgi:hypothetical protein
VPPLSPAFSLLQVGIVASIIVILTILLSIICFCMSSMPEYRERAAKNIVGAPELAFDQIEAFCVAIFTIEYLGRFFTLTAVPNSVESAYISRFGFDKMSNAAPPMSYPWTLQGTYAWARTNAIKFLSFIFAPLNAVDFVAIVPFYINLGSPTDLGGSLAILRVLRLARVLRLFKLSKRMEGVQVMGRTMLAAADAMGFLIFFVLLAVVLFGSIIFFCEGGEWDDNLGGFARPNLLNTGMELTPFKSIPHSFWWTLVTMTTVGYGDFYPTTDAGRVIGSFVMVLGILVLAMPITVIGSAFSEEYNKAKSARRERERAAQPSTPTASADSPRAKAGDAAGVMSEGGPTPTPRVDSTEGDGAAAVVVVAREPTHALTIVSPRMIEPSSSGVVDAASTTTVRSSSPVREAKTDDETATVLSHMQRTLAAQAEEIAKLRADNGFIRSALEQLLRGSGTTQPGTMA